MKLNHQLEVDQNQNLDQNHPGGQGLVGQRQQHLNHFMNMTLMIIHLKKNMKNIQVTLKNKNQYMRRKRYQNLLLAELSLQDEKIYDSKGLNSPRLRPKFPPRRPFKQSDRRDQQKEALSVDKQKLESQPNREPTIKEETQKPKSSFRDSN